MSGHISKHIHRPEIEAIREDRVIIATKDRKEMPSKTEGGLRVYFEFPSFTLDAHVTKVPPGGKSKLHRHMDEAIILILQGKGHSRIGDKQVQWQQGDVLFIPKWNWHQHFASPETGAEYFAVTNQPLLENLGRFNVTEEPEEGAHHSSSS
jgi:gentisate 1,2-dioxygenase